ncbi:MAG TPA: hypothetical protein VLE46_15210 [Nitrospira sp.]|nr:hypothetical protein [Nitrospira sp.]
MEVGEVQSPITSPTNLSDFSHVKYIHNLFAQRPVEALKTINKNASHALPGKVRLLDKRCLGSHGICSTGHFVSTVEITEKIGKRYVADKGRESIISPPQV